VDINLSEESYKIPMDGRWNLEDLYIFPHTYEQVYFLIYSLLPHDDEEIQEKIKYAYSAFPWQGGYSAVNFYNKLKFTTPKQNRPQVLTIQYASPGWIELSLIIGVAVSVQRIVIAVSASIREANSVYSEIHKGMSERKLLRIKIEKEELALEEQNAEYIQKTVERMVKLLGLKDIEQMHKKSGSPLKTLKILLSLYRRVRTLAEFQKNGKTKL
jgi:hypothetical protein